MPSFRLMSFLVCVSLVTASAFGAVPIPKPPSLDARAYVLIDYETGRVLAADKAEVQNEPASITKLMTGYGVFRALREKRLSLTDSVTISDRRTIVNNAGSPVMMRVNAPDASKGDGSLGKVDQVHISCFLRVRQQIENSHSNAIKRRLAAPEYS